MGVVQKVENGKFVESNSAASLADAVNKSAKGNTLDKDAFLQKFDKDWLRYNRDIIRKVEEYEAGQ